MGHYRGAFFRLLIDHVQPDPFARPTRLRVRIPSRDAGFPPALHDTATRRTALADLLARKLAGALAGPEREHGSGVFEVNAGAQTVIPRTAVLIEGQNIEARFTLGLPARGRRVLGGGAATLLCERLPRAIKASLLASAFPPEEPLAWVRASDDQQALRAALAPRGLVAFVANGAILPRRSGIDDRPLEEDAVPFQSPPPLEVEIPLPDGRSVRGMGIRRGVTVIVGGGYHGKSTLLSALARGVYDHIPGDGREQVITLPDAVKVRAESGRSVAGVDLRPFLGALPGGRDTANFRTANASGSTSQAAGILESLEMGARLLLLDEDTCATNFMVRDARMQALVPDALEPITPFVDKVRALFDGRGVSTVLVMGGSGDYLDVADCVIRMDNYRAGDVTDRAREIAADYPSKRKSPATGPFGEITARRPDPASLRASRGHRDVRIDARGPHTLMYGRSAIDLSASEQIEEAAQTRAIGWAIHLMASRHLRGAGSLREAVEATADEMRRRGLDVLTPHPFGDLALPRALEIAGAVNRMRQLRIARAPSRPEEST
ncbi:MAG: ABC-ATPase domain-containing protein [Myxococcota bacterium]